MWLCRFDYDWERGIPVKFNDKFEFPAELDMAPFTVEGIMAKEKRAAGNPDHPAVDPALFTLAGVLVHSGQANGGHYYSFIRERQEGGKFDDKSKWYKFDDVDVRLIVLCDR